MSNIPHLKASEEFGANYITPVKKFEELFEKYFDKKIFHHLHSTIKILVLGCNDGSHDLFPLLKKLKKSLGAINFEITALELNKYALKEVSEKLINKHYLLLSEEDNVSEFLYENITINLIQTDIELDEKAIIKYGKYDIIIAFSVLHHLVNWKKCIIRLIHNLKKKGDLLITEYDDKFIGAWENNRKKYQKNSFGDVDNTVDSFFEVHKKTDDKYQAYYRNTLLETDISLIRHLLCDSCLLKKLYIKYKTDDNKRKSFLKYVIEKSTPIRWGLPLNVNFGKEFKFNKNEPLDAEIHKILIEDSNSDWERLIHSHEAIINLHIFTKERRIDLTKENFEFEFNYGESLLTEAYLSDSHDSNYKRDGKAYLQVLQFAQALNKQIRLCLHLNWKTSLTSDGKLVVDFKKQEEIMASVLLRHSVNNDVNGISSTLDALSIFNDLYWLQGSKLENGEAVPISEPIFLCQNDKIFWIIELVEDSNFSTEIKNICDDEFRAVIFKIPANYLNSNYNKNPSKRLYFDEKLKNKGIQFQVSPFKHFSYIDFKTTYQKIKDEANSKIKNKYNETWYLNTDLTHSENETQKRERKIKDILITLSIPDNSHKVFINSSVDIDKVSNLFAKNLPFYATSAQIGMTLIMPNKVFTKRNESIINGTFFVCFEDMTSEKYIEEISNSKKDRQGRLLILKKLLDNYSQKAELPEITEALIHSQNNLKYTFIKNALASIFSRNLSHHHGSHIISYILTLLDELVELSSVLSHTELENIKKQLLKLRIFFSEESPCNENWKSLDLSIQDIASSIGNVAIEHSLKNLKKYLIYMQERMELIAEIGSPHKQPLSVLYNINDIFSDFMNNRLVIQGLIDGAIKNDNIYKVNMGDFPFKKSEITILGKPNSLVSLPSGQVGVQAIFTILEDIVRNAKNHSLPNKYNNYSFDITVSEPTNNAFKSDYWLISIKDEYKVNNSNVTQRDDIFINNLQEKYLWANSITDEGSLRSKGWGILEMKIASAYLINYPLEHIDSANELSYNLGHIELLLNEKVSIKYPPLLNIRLEENTKRLIHEFYVLKPKFAIIDEQFNVSHDDKFNEIYVAKIEDGNRYDITVTTETTNNDAIRLIKLQPNDSLLNDLTPQNLWSRWMKEFYVNNFDEIDSILESSNIGELVNLDEQSSFDFGKVVFFDNHASTFREKNTKNFFNKFYYYEYFKSKTGIAKTLNYEKGSLDELKLKSAILTNVSIFDERIQTIGEQEDEYLYKSENEKMKINEVLRLKKIYMPTKSEINLESEQTQYSDFYEKIMSRLETNDHFIILHYSLFTTICNRSKENCDSAFQTLSSLIKESGKYLILTSGKGRPSDLPPESYYINLVSIRQYLTEYPSKYHLVNMLFSSRKSRENIRT